MFVAALTVVAALVFVLPMIHAVRAGWLKAPDPGSRSGEIGFRHWLIRGWGIPIFVWIGWNSVALLGLRWGWIPLIPNFLGSPAQIFLAGTGWGVFWATLVWTAFTLAWLMPQVVRGIRQRDEFGALLWLVGVGLTILLAGSVWVGSWELGLLFLTGGLAVLFHWSLPLVHRSTPSYARALGRIKRGHYAEAEQEVIQQLEEKADDYAGWMMLAELYAEQFGQLNEAEQTVLELCDQPGLSSFDVSRALTRLADWQLNRGDNPAAARATLEQLIRRCPGTPFARTAENRIRQLPVDVAELRERRQPRVIQLGALRAESPREIPLKSAPAVDRLEAQAEAATLQARLEIRADDLVTRLRLARVCVERLGQLEAGLTQLRLLRESPSVTAGQEAEALAIEAAWRLRVFRDEPTARVLLNRLLAEYPENPQSLAARRQLDLLDYPELHPAKPPPPLRIVVRLPPNPPEP